MATAILRFRDRAERTVDVAPGASILAAALQSGIRLVHQCESGSCGTCVGRIVAGATATVPDRALALLPSEIAQGLRLTCSTIPASDVIVEFDYPSSLLTGPQPDVIEANVTGIDWVCRSVIRLDVGIPPGSDFRFDAGQYVRFRIPGSDQWRSYSMATTAAATGPMQFLIRYIAGGAMSEYLKTACRLGDPIDLEGPMGSFSVVPEDGPILMVAGGTGLAPIMAMLDSLRTASGPRRSVVLCFGCADEDDVFYLDELELRVFWMPTLTLRTAVERKTTAASASAIGTAVSLITDADLAHEGLAAYLCGPPGMIEAARERLIGGGVASERIFAEQFRPT